MTDFKYAVLGYNNLHHGIYYVGNYGDEIQSIAAERCLPRVDTIIDRNVLNRFSNPDKHVLLMNGFFGSGIEGTDGFPPSKSIIPIYFSFHIEESARDFYTSHECLEHFKKWEPIGCRDCETSELLGSKGIDTFFSKCLTLTFDKRTELQGKGKLFIVDGGDMQVKIPEFLINSNLVERVTHIIRAKHNNYRENMKAAQSLLDRYKNEASAVITSKLHCALPCMAMGIPRIYVPPFSVGGHDGRVKLYAEVGGTLCDIRPCAIISTNKAFKYFPKILRRVVHKAESILLSRERQVFEKSFHWQFDTGECEDEKREIRDSLNEQLKRQLGKL